MSWGASAISTDIFDAVWAPVTRSVVAVRLPLTAARRGGPADVAAVAVWAPAERAGERDGRQAEQGDAAGPERAVGHTHAKSP